MANVLRVTGVPEENGENLKEKFKNICTVLNVQIADNDIASIHRKGSNNSSRTNPRPIIVEFRSVDLKYKVVSERKKLKDSVDHRRIYLREELTQLKWKMFYVCMNVADIKYVESRYGTILCYKNSMNDQQDRSGNVLRISSPNDLLKLGLAEIDYNSLGLSDIAFSK